MFIIWYALFSIFYIFTITLHFFFCKVLRFNSNTNLFSILLLKIDYFFNFYNSKINIVPNQLSKNQENKLKFKNLFNEYSYLYKNSQIGTAIVSSSLNKTLYKNLSNYSVDLNYLFFLITNLNLNNKTNRKLNLNFFYNKVLTVNNKNVALNLNNVKSNSIYSTVKKVQYYYSKSSIIISDKLNNVINKNWIVKFSPSNFIKYIDYLNINTYNILYLRKSKVFNKGRYSRNRQYYRTGVYWCLYINIIAVVGIYFWFYRFTMNFGYLWWLLFAFISSFILPKAIKYRLYNPITIINSFTSDLVWLGSLLNSVFVFFKSLLNLIKNFLKFYNINLAYFNLKNSDSFFYANLIKFIIFSEKCNTNQIYLWEYNNVNYYNNSIINSKSIIVEKFKNIINRFILIIISK